MTARRLVVAVGTLALVMVGVAVGGCIAAGLTFGQVLDYYEFTNTAIGGAFVACGAVIGWYVHRNAVGWLFLGAGIAHLLTASLAPVTYLMVDADGVTPAVAWLATIAGQVWGFGVTGLFLVALLLFPDGRLPSRRWAAVVVLIAASGIGQFLQGLLSPGPILPGQPARSPVALATDAPDWVLNVLGLTGSVASIAVVASLVVRYVRGGDRIRRQLLWLILAMIAILVLNLQRFVTGTGPIPLLLTFLLVPVAIAIAIVRYGLLDIRLVVSRTVTYGVLLALVTALFAGIVAALGLVLPTGGQRAASIVAAIVVAIAFAPLRSLLIRSIGRALYGRRADPAGIATRLGGELAGTTDSLDGALALIRSELRLPYLAIRGGEAPALAESGAPSDRTALLPLAGTGEGLLVGLRRGERALHPDDRRALELLSVPLLVARRALDLSAEVAAARTEVVTERERERQRLQRELHDGLGPRLTGIAFRLDAAANVVDRDADRTALLLAESRADLRHAITTVREVVHGLRPIELEDGGLVPALRSRIAEIAGSAPMSVLVEADDRLPSSTAAVDVAVYRVALEAVTNAVRHSTGSVCRVELRGDGSDLLLVVHDDGAPSAGWRAGVGLTSMRHRTVEVGGSLDAGPGVDGWSVIARFPSLAAV